MRNRRWTWILLGLLVAAGFVLLTRHSLILRTQRAGGGGPVAGAAKIAPFRILSTNTPATLAAETRTNRLWRLSNTTRTLAELGRDPHAILLANALIDTRAGLSLAIPDKLRAKGDPKAYIVQAHGPISPTFRAMLASSGGRVVSYIPNNAYLVMMDQTAAEGIQGLGFAVVPYEPYYKVASSLLPWMDRPLPSGATLNVEVFPGTEQDFITAIPASGGTVLSQMPSQNGTIFNVLPPADWTAVAGLPYPHIVEPSSRRVPANDLARATVSVAPDTQTTSNYMGLSGSNVLVEVNDSGIDATHPDFETWGSAPIRVIGDSVQSLVDTDGHGTHVAGIIAGDGFKSMTVTNAQGSIMPATNGQFRGMAPNAMLYSVGGVYGGGDTNPISDMYLQEAPALTNALISNNSWVYAGDETYDLAAASYDAAVRDALPLTIGSQPVLFVFAAGDEGNGNDSSDPGAGTADTVDSPGTAKNVITVGAIQEDRNITNQVTNAVGTVSEPWQAETSTGYRIAGFSSRGNVGINTEGVNGRFKPDVVAPGTFIVSTRSSQWDINSYFTSSDTNNNVVDLTVEVPGNTLSENDFPTIPTNTVQVTISAVPDANSPTPFPALPIYTWRFGGTPLQNMYTNEVSIPPDNPTLSQILVDEQSYISAFPYAISNSTAQPIEFDIIQDTVTTNNPGNYELVLSNLNQDIGTPNPASTGPGPYYRYETGTSMSAANVSGVLADIQDYFTNTLRLRPSPALLKAMLINGARPTGEYGLQVANSINYEGWGLANLTNTVPAGLTNVIGAGCSEFILDQNPTNALATGGSHTFLVNVTNATAQALLPLRVTLAWTDPPGDPAAAIKLVNNLDLVVTNLGANPPIVYYGNDISSGDFNNPHGTNDVVAYDYVNNVKNVYISQPVGTNYSITVLARDVNVNAVTANSNNVAQDFALVISCGEGEVTNAMTVADGGQLYNPTGGQNITYIIVTNTPLMDQFAGASTPLLGTNQVDFAPGSPYAGDAVDTLGMTNQWHFYVVTNSMMNPTTNGGGSLSNAAFITFLPNTLSIPRMGVYEADVGNATTPGADIDLYVTTDSNLLTLSPVTISNCINGTQIGASAGAPPVFNGASLNLTGTQFVVDTNSTLSQVYYIGVYSERQLAAEYDFLSVFTATPFSQMNNGNQIVNGIPLPNAIPDGSPKYPGNAYTFGLALYPMQVGQVIVNDEIVHQNYGDLIGTLNHNGANAVLNNHDSLGSPPGPYNLTYSDGGVTNVPGAILSDGPGSLQNFFGTEGIGVWMLTESDTALTHTGYVAGLNITLVPYTPPTHGINVTVAPGSWVYTFQDVPVGYTNLTVFATNTDVPPVQPPLELFLNYGSDPTLADTNEEVLLTNCVTGTYPTGVLPGNDISTGPPLAPGRYFIGIFNPGLTTANAYIIATLAFSASAITNLDYEGGPMPIPDDSVSYSSILVANPSLIQSLDVGVAVADPRISDLVFHLISPDGTRYLLMENRGGTTASGAGLAIIGTNGASLATNYLYLNFTENTNLTTTPIKFAPTPFVPSGAVSNIFFDGFETAAAGDYTNGNSFGNGWSVISNQVSVVTDPANAYAGTNFLALASGVISNTLPTVAGQTYTLSFAYRGPGIVGWWRGESNTLDSSGFNDNGANNGGSYTNGEVGSAFSFLGTGEYVEMPGNSILNVGPGPGFTIEGWINPSVLNSERTSLEWNNGSLYGVHLNISTGSGAFGTGPGCLYANLLGVGGGDHYISSVANLVQPNVFQHVALTYNKSAIQAKLYYNGGSIIPAQYVNFAGSFTPQTGPGYNVVIGERISNPPVACQWNGLDEMSVYNRTLSASEINAIYQRKTAGKFDPAIFGISPALSLAEAGVSLNGGTPVVINGNNTNWQVYTTTFTATQSGTPLEIAGLEPGMLLDNFSVTSVAGSLYYQPEQDISGLDNTSAQGLWQLEIQDNRVGATTPPPELLSWQLQFTFANTNLVPIPILNPGQPTSGTVAGSVGGDPINWYQVNVPAGAAAAFNLLLSASGPVNLVYSTNNPPTTLFPGDAQLIGNATNGVSTLTPTNYPPLVPGGVYYLGVQNTNSPSVNYTIEVNFASSLQPAPIGGGQPVTNTINGGTNSFSGGNMDYYAIMVPPNADFATNLLLFATSPVNVWFNQTNLPGGGSPPDYALFSSSMGGAVVLGTNSTPPLVPGQTYYLAVQNTNAANVTYAIQVNFHLLPPIPSNGVAWIQVPVPTNADWATNDLISASAPVDLWWTTNTPQSTNTALLLLQNVTNAVLVFGTNPPPPLIVPGGTYWLGVETNGVTTYNVQVYFHLVPPPPPVTNGIAWTTVNVPANADMATNFLISATAPVDLWWTTNNPPSTNGNAVLLLPDGAYPTGTNGFVVLGTNTSPAFIVPGGTYYLGVETNGITTYNIAVKFHLVALPPPTNLVSIVYTNIAGKNGYLLSWYGPTNDLFQVQWAGALTASVAWNAFTNVITYTTYITPNNSLFQFFDDGSQTGGFGVTRFYRLEVLGVFTNSPPVFLGTPPSQDVYALSTFAVTNAATNPDVPNPLTYNLIAPPAGMTISSNGLILWIPTLAQTNHVYTITTVVTDTNPYVPVNGSLSATNSFSLTVLPPYSLGTGQTQKSQPLTNSLVSGGLTWYEVSVPVIADYATNILLFANPQPVNVWFRTNLPPSITNPGDLTLLSNTTGGQAVININNGTPLLPAGSTYWLGVQNSSSATITYAIAVNFHLVFPPPPTNTLSIIYTNISGSKGFLLSWYAPTNDLFQVQWAPTPAAPVAWNSFSDIIAYNTYITPTNSLFQFFDNGSETGGFGSSRVYRLVLLGLATNVPPVFAATPPNQAIFALSTLTVTNNATDVYSPPQTLTYTLPGAPSGMTISPAGIITWTPTAGQESTTNVITTVVFNNGLPPLGATNTFQVIVLPIPGPAAFTAPATWVTGTNAQLNGFASPNGTPSLAWFQWGPYPLFTNQTAPVNVGSGYGVVWMTNGIANLLNGNGYYFRLVVSNAVGAAYGADQEFSDGSIVAWGDNSSGQTNIPAGLTNLVAMAGGEYHVLALENNGTVAAWGDDTDDQTNIPAGLSNVVAVSAGVYYSLALVGNGTVVGWGDNSFGQLDVPAGLSNVVAIAAGYDHSVALQSNGVVTVWGDNTYGQTNIPPGLGNVVTIASGWSHTLAVENNGTVVAWGYGFDGETNVPENLTNAIAVAGGAEDSLALRSDGTVSAWGDNFFEETSIPAGLNSVQAIAAGDYHNLALRSVGTVIAWGDGTGADTNVPPGLSNVVMVAGGGYFGLALQAAVTMPLVIPDIKSVTWVTNSVVLQWTAPTYESFQVQWAPALPATSWTTVPGLITSATGVFQFVDNGSLTAPLGAKRFYRLIVQ